MIPNQKHLFNIAEDITYLNCAYLSPQLRSVTEAGHKSVSGKENPWLLTAPDFFTLTEQTRSLFAELIETRADDIAFIPAVSYGVSVAAMNVKVEENQVVVVLEDQFPSNVGERSNFALMPMAFAALKQIWDWQVPEIASTLSAVTAEIAQRATALGLNVAPPHLRAGHMLGIRFPEGAPTDLVERLSHNQIYVSVRGNSIRISPHLYNT